MAATVHPQELDCIVGRGLESYRRLRLVITTTAHLQVHHAGGPPQVIELPPGATWEDLILILIRLLDLAA